MGGKSTLNKEQGHNKLAESIFHLDYDKINVYPGDRQCYIHLPEVDDFETELKLDRKIRIYIDSKSSLSENNTLFKEVNVEGATFIKVVGLENNIDYKIYVYLSNDKITESTRFFLVRCSHRFTIIPRDVVKWSDINEFFTVFINLVNADRDDLIVAYEGMVTHFGEEDGSIEQLTVAEVTEIRDLEKNLLNNGELTTVEYDRYKVLKNKIATGNTTMVVFRLLSREPSSVDNIPFSRNKNLNNKREFAGYDPELNVYRKDIIRIYDNMVEFKVLSKSPVEADNIALYIQYLIEDASDVFIRNGVKQVYFWDREPDDLAQTARSNVFQRVLRVYVQTSRITEMFPLVIERIQTTIKFSAVTLDCSVLIHNKDFS